MWIRPRKWVRSPHASSKPESLWWYAWAKNEPTRDTETVIDAYLKQCARGRSLPSEFARDLDLWLQELNRPQQSGHFWTIPAFALANKMPSKGFCKRLRELEKIAIRLFPSNLPAWRKPIVITEDQKLAIRASFLKTGDFAAVAKEFGLEPFRVGQLCRAEKAQRKAELELAQSGGSISTDENTTIG